MFGATIPVRNVNEALQQGMDLMRTHGVPSKSRGLKTLRVPGPVLTLYSAPCERVLFNPVRDANPFFHLMESLWIIGGSNRVALPAHFSSKIAQFSDNGQTFHGAYGYRLRGSGHPQLDQVGVAIRMLQEKPDTRQCVLSIWEKDLDLGTSAKDMPCNDMIMFDIVDDALNMTVCNRSNDMILGAYGANVVQFSMLQEFVAVTIGAKVGEYVQMSNNYHVYVDNPFWLNQGEHFVDEDDAYKDGNCKPFPLASSQHDAARFDRDCQRLCAYYEAGSPADYRSDYFQFVVEPVQVAYELYKANMLDTAMRYLEDHCQAEDWALAMIEWLERRVDNRKRKDAA